MIAFIIDSCNDLGGCGCSVRSTVTSEHSSMMEIINKIAAALKNCEGLTVAEDLSGYLGTVPAKE